MDTEKAYSHRAAETTLVPVAHREQSPKFPSPNLRIAKPCDCRVSHTVLLNPGKTYHQSLVLIFIMYITVELVFKDEAHK